MKIIFFGLGSIGKRHAKILHDDSSHELYAYRSGEGAKGNDLGIEEVYTWKDVERLAPDVAFITNPTFLHIDTAMKCAKLGMKLFIEKPIGSSIDGLDALLKEIKGRNIISYVAYNLRFHPIIERLREYLKQRKIQHVSVYTSSFLPEWRPVGWHLESYSAVQDKGGGVILDLSHEFDYIEYLFGNINDIKGIFGKASNVTVDAEDFLDASIKTEITYINLHLDFLSKHSERSIKVDCEDGYLFADLIGNRIEINEKGGSFIEKYDVEKNEIYKKQIDYFFENIDNGGMMNNLQEASGLFRKIVDFKKAAE